MKNEKEKPQPATPHLAEYLAWFTFGPDTRAFIMRSKRIRLPGKIVERITVEKIRERK